MTSGRLGGAGAAESVGAVDAESQSQMKVPQRVVRRAVFSLILLTVACAEDPPQSEPETPEVLAMVGDERIEREAFEEFVSLQAEHDPTGQTDREKLWIDFLTQRILVAAARKQGIEVTQLETAQYLPGISQEGVDQEEDHQAGLAKELQDYLTIQKYMSSKVDVSQSVGIRELQEYYAEHFEEFEADDQVRVLEIVVPSGDQAAQLRSTLQPGDFGAFRETARSVSTGKTATDGGELGPFGPGQLPERFEEVIFKLKLGEISAVFHSEHGYHLFMVEERIQRHAQKFYEVRQQIFDTLIAQRERQAIEDVIETAVSGTRVEIFDRHLAQIWRERNAQLP